MALLHDYEYEYEYDYYEYDYYGQGPGVVSAQKGSLERTRKL